jgi:hypothetical protein
VAPLAAESGVRASEGEQVGQCVRCGVGCICHGNEPATTDISTTIGTASGALGRRTSC